MKTQNKKVQNSYAFIAKEMRLYMEAISKPKKVKKKPKKRTSK